MSKSDRHYLILQNSSIFYLSSGMYSEMQSKHNSHCKAHFWLHISAQVNKELNLALCVS